MSQSTENLSPGPSAKYSDLDSFSESYHLVVGVTEASINTMVKKRIKWDENPEKTIWYKSGSPVTEIARINGIDPFNPDGVNADQLKQLQDAGFAFAVKTGNGPGGPRPLPEIMDLKDANSAIFNLYFTHFSLVQLKDGTLNVQSQPDDNFWIFSYDVSLNLSSASFSDLTPEQQAAVKNIAPESALSVDQLLLDFNTLSAKSQPNVGSDDWNPVLQKFIQDHYLADLKNRGAMTLSRQVKKTGSDGDSSTLVPTDIRLGVSQYLDADNRRHDTSSLSTLNYLMATKNASLPSSFNQFNWNWINSDQANDANGCMAISRDVFAQIMGDLLNPLLRGMYIIPKPDIKFKEDNLFLHPTDSWIVQISNHFELDPSANAISLEEVREGSMLLKGHYVKEGKCHRNYSTPRPDLDNNQTYHLDTKVMASGQVITVEVVSTMDLYLKADSWEFGSVKGSLGGYKLVCEYKLSVNHDGMLSADLASKTIDPIKPDLDQGVMASFDGVKAAANNMGGGYDRLTQNLFNNFAGQLTNKLKNSAQFFVFPGGNTFTFSSPFFSDHQDLITQITYLEE